MIRCLQIGTDLGKEAMATLREDALNKSKVYNVALVTGHRTWTTRERPVIGLSGILEFTDTHGDKISVPQSVVWVEEPRA